MRVGVQRASLETPLETGVRLVSVCAHVLNMRARALSASLSLRRWNGLIT